MLAVSVMCDIKVCFSLRGNLMQVRCLPFLVMLRGGHDYHVHCNRGREGGIEEAPNSWYQNLY